MQPAPESHPQPNGAIPMSLHVTLETAPTVTTPAATMRTLASPSGSPDLAIAVWRTELPAGAAGPRHTIDVDHFVTVLSGSLEVTVDDETYVVPAGDGVKLPGGTPRTIAATADGPVVTLTVGAPGARATVGDGDPVPVPWTV